jgi:hypothetical protein
MEWIALFGVPGAITGLIFWALKKHIDKIEKKRQEREENTEKLILLMMQTSRSTNILAEATARAVQRIPDAKCNGDMTEALAKVAEIQEKEKEFLMDNGIKHIFG